MKIGYNSSIRTVSPVCHSYKGRKIKGSHTQYLITRCNSDNFNIKKEKHIFHKNYDNLVYSCTVPEHIILVRRNGKAIWCGNCMCQDIIKFCLSELRQAEIRIVGGDTDSAFVQLQADNLRDAVAEGKGICEYLNEKIDTYLNNIYNIQNNTINIGLETISDKFFVDTMKHYVKRNLWSDGVELDEPELEIKGLDLKKRATSQLAADVQRELIKIMFDEDDPIEKMANYLSIINNTIKGMNWGYVCKRGALNKPLDKYSIGNQSARGARNSQKYLDKQYLPGSNPFLGVFKETPEKLNGKFISISGDFVLSFDAEDIPGLIKAGFELNYDRIIDTELFKKTEHILGVFGEDYYSIVESNDSGDFMDI
jgi:DNA polymerase elongation subunit (family B)